MSKKYQDNCKYLLVIVILAITQFSYAQDISTIKKNKAFVIGGGIGASTNYYSSNERVNSRPPWAWNLHGNFRASIYGIALPFSFTVSQYGNSFFQPFSQFGLSPHYKWAKLHIGYRSMPMSQLVFEGQSFRGVGIELTPKLLRFAAFYGRLNRKVNEDTTSGRFSQPQFSRNAYGVKLGIGNKKQYVDLIYFHAKDDSNSVNIISKDKYRSQENTVIGTSFQLKPFKKITLKGDIAMSRLTEDLGTDVTDSISGGFANKIMSSLMQYRASTDANWATQSSIMYNQKNYNTTLSYRRVQPGFKSLGTPYLLNDIELINWVNNLMLLKNKMNVNVGLSNQRNNLNRNLNSQMNTTVGTLNVNTAVNRKFIFNINYSGYRLNQKDGVVKLNDSFRLQQQIHQVNIMPSYMINRKSLSHSFTPTLSYMKLNDANVVTSPFTSSRNISTSFNYVLGFVKRGVSVHATVLRNQYKQDTTRFTTYGANIGGSAGLLKNRALNIQLSTGYMLNQSSISDVQGNLTFSGNVSYRRKKHALNLHANFIYTPYNPINEVVATALQQTVASRNFMGSISYQYSF